MTREQLIQKLSNLPNVPVLFDVEVDNPSLKKAKGHISLGIEYIFYDEEKDRIIMSSY